MRSHYLRGILSSNLATLIPFVMIGYLPCPPPPSAYFNPPIIRGAISGAKYLILPLSISTISGIPHNTLGNGQSYDLPNNTRKKKRYRATSHQAGRIDRHISSWPRLLGWCVLSHFSFLFGWIPPFVSPPPNSVNYSDRFAVYVHVYCVRMRTRSGAQTFRCWD